LVNVGITGHRGLSAEITAQVSSTLDFLLSDYDPEGLLGGQGTADLVGLTCLADGADTLFADHVLAFGGQIEAIVPATKYRAGFPEEHQRDFDRLLTQANEVHRLDFTESDSEAHMAASVLMLSLVTQLIAVWDGQPSRGYGGTADVVAEAKRRNIPVHVVWPAGATRP